MTDTRNDSYSSVIAQAAASRQLAGQLVDLGGMAFGARWFYAQGGLMARIIDMPADLATARGITVQGATSELTAEMDRLKLLPNASDALRWSLLDGGGALIVMSQDSGTLADPLKPETLIRIEEFRVVSLTQITGDRNSLYKDPTQTNYGTPEFYNVKINNTGGEPVRVHESRLIEVPGAPIAVTAGVDLRDVPWAGRGVSPKAVLAIQRYHRAVGWAEKLLEKAQQAVHGMKGLASMLMAGQESVVRQRIDLVDSNRTAMNGVAVDSEDTYTVISTTLSGVKDVLTELEVAVGAETGYPVTVLFGRTPGGLNASGDSDWDMVYDHVSQLQGRRLKPALERAISLIYAQSGAGLEDKPDAWQIKFNPLKPQSEQQAADVANKKADTVKKIVEALKIVQETQAVSQDEARAYLASEGMFGVEAEDDGSGQGGAARYAQQT